jgi:hypothetical protein
MFQLGKDMFNAVQEWLFYQVENHSYVEILKSVVCEVGSMQRRLVHKHSKFTHSF